MAVTTPEALMADARALIRLIVLGGTLAGGAWPEAAQDSKPPADSESVALAGCAKGRVFTVRDAPAHEPQQTAVANGRKFRLTGPKDALNQIRLHEGQLVEITGLVRKSDLKGPGGIAIAGGRIRIGGSVPRSQIGNPARDPANNVAVLDVSSWRQLDGSCRR